MPFITGEDFVPRKPRGDKRLVSVSLPTTIADNIPVLAAEAGQPEASYLRTLLDVCAADDCIEDADIIAAEALLDGADTSRKGFRLSLDNLAYIERLTDVDKPHAVAITAAVSIAMAEDEDEDE